MRTLFTTYRTYTIIGVASIIVLVAFAGYYVMTTKSTVSKAPFTPHFTYDESAFSGLPKPMLTSPFAAKEVYDLDEQVFALVSENKLSATAAAQLYAYVATAEHDMAAIAEHVGDMHFTTAPLVKGVVCEFLPDHCAQLVVSNDPYSVAIANSVIAKVHERNVADKASLRTYPFATTYAQYWDSTKKYSGTDVGSWKPWRIPNVQALREPEPPTPQSPEGVALVQDILTRLANLSESERNSALANSMARGTGTVSASTLKNLTGIQRAQGTEMMRALRERMLLAQAVTDALIVAYDNKYTYWYPRPESIEPTIKPITPTPADPSYPSTSVSAESVGTALMAAWYPARTAELDDHLKVIMEARVNAGIHSQNDVDAGARVGKHVADIILAE